MNLYNISGIEYKEETKYTKSSKHDSKADEVVPLHFFNNQFHLRFFCNGETADYVRPHLVVQGIQSSDNDDIQEIAGYEYSIPDVK